MAVSLLNQHSGATENQTLGDAEAVASCGEFFAGSSINQTSISACVDSVQKNALTTQTNRRRVTVILVRLFLSQFWNGQATQSTLVSTTQVNQVDPHTLDNSLGKIHLDHPRLRLVHCDVRIRSDSDAFQSSWGHWLSPGAHNKSRRESPLTT
jgi:hypothetical protein